MLVVDDDALVLDNIAAMLDDLGHTVIEAEMTSDGQRVATATGTFVVVALTDEQRAALFAGHPVR